MKLKADRVIANIGQLLTMAGEQEPAGRGDQDQDPVAGLGLVLDAALALCGEKVVWAGRERDLAAAVDTEHAEIIDVGGRVVLPGLVDCHTHAIFAGSRAQEFARRVGGATYDEILAEGGGIHATVRATRDASQESLVATGRRRLDTFLGFGVTTVEIKSGYGLEVGSELKILRAAAELDRLHPISVVATLLGAHVVPTELASRRSVYLDQVIHEMIPRAAEEKLARFCDVFCDRGAFDLDETRRVLEAGLAHGLRPKLHGEQLMRSGSVDLAIELGAASIDHLEHASGQDAARLAKSGTVAVLLPGATYFLGRTDFADGRRLADAGCKLAVSTDFNPGSSNTENLPLIMNMACLYNRLYPREAILGATRWAADALELADRIGSLEPGHDADVLVLDMRDYRNFVYHFGVQHTHLVFKHGRLVWSSTGSRPDGCLD
jgi:imidazolonepropionase